MSKRPWVPLWSLMTGVPPVHVIFLNLLRLGFRASYELVSYLILICYGLLFSAFGVILRHVLSKTYEEVASSTLLLGSARPGLDHAMSFSHHVIISSCRFLCSLCRILFSSCRVVFPSCCVALWCVMLLCSGVRSCVCCPLQ